MVLIGKIISTISCIRKYLGPHTDIPTFSPICILIVICRYTLLTPDQLPQYLGCQFKWSRKTDDLILKQPLCLIPSSLPLRFDQLASRTDFERWLHRVLIRILSPPQPTRRPGIFMPSTLATFMRLLIHTNEIGYPSHWLSEVVERIINDRLTSEHRPYPTSPIPATELTRFHPAHKVQLSPWMADIEIVVATAYPAFPFSVRVPRGFPTIADLGIFQAPISNLQGVDGSEHYCIPRHPVLAILFVAPGMTPHEATVCSRSILFSDQASPGDQRQIMLSIHKIDVDTTTGAGTLSWKMHIPRFETMKSKGWSLCLWCVDFSVQRESFILVS